MTDTVTFRNGPIFDGVTLLNGHAARFETGRLSALAPASDLPRDGTQVDLGGDILSPGYVDLQVNGGGGVLLNDAPTPATLARIAAAHRSLGAVTILPTLITAGRDTTRAAINAAVTATRDGTAGIGGLHLEGPHLSLARKGAHDGTLIRAMEDDDLALYCQAARDLPVLMVTLAPESARPDQVAALTRAGAIVALGHSDTDFDTARAYTQAGARCVTHLFNAMSQLGSRAPGLVGAALAEGALSAGLIADAVHVHPQAIRAALAAKTGPGEVFLVSDAMAVAGTDLTGFDLDGRRITRTGGRLTLADGTLAGADLDLTRAIRVMTTQVGLPLARALAMATTLPRRLIGLPTAPDAIPLTQMIRIRAALSGASPVA